ncbi:MAG: 23S rRNA (adenine(1618)-N(6))-methyltransferase RlmF [Candidatus Delongbacteria bacterium]|nr:23S rRNA (adenine(1618)-N(6))-methyltransferase RlmF [Candidatus Delongbacteria bacterium]
MSTKKTSKEKLNLHKRNKNREKYDLKAMCDSNPELIKYIQPNKLGIDSINFADPSAVKILNKAILHYYYGIKYWEFPKENLCPAIPGRAEYIHHVADLLSENNNGEIPLGESITCLDIGIGACCVYPIIGVTEYKWNFIGSDISSKSIESSQNIVNSNPTLKGKVKCTLQNHTKNIFRGIIKKEDKIDITICNPPFHSSIEEAIKGTARKVKNLTGIKTNSPKLNFSGNNNELVYEGGELKFISNMILESKEFAKDCLWFSTLVSKESNLKKIYKILKQNNPTEIRTINFETGNKSSRIVTWTYLTSQEKKMWQEKQKNKSN